LRYHRAIRRLAFGVIEFFSRALETELETLCLGAATGSFLRRVAPAEKLNRYRLAARSPTPATDGERVFVYFGLWFDQNDFAGRELWRKPLPIR
jgi:hypothetical protein